MNENLVRTFLELEDVADGYESINLLCAELSDAVNNCFFEAKENAHELLHSSLFSYVACRWIQYLDYAYENRLYDGRNEYSVDIGHNLYIQMFSEKIEYSILPLVEHSAAWLQKNEATASDIIVKRMSTEHRTLQQTFSSLVFYYISEAFPEEIKKLIEAEVLSSRFERTPFI